MVAQSSVQPARNRAERRAQQFRRTDVSVQEAAVLTGVSEMTIRRRIADKSLPAVRFGPKLLRIKVADLEALGRPVA